MSKIEVSHIYKIFGPHPDRWLKAVQDGMSKEELLTRSGHTLGLRDISLSIDEGSIYVIMGLSGSGKSTLIRHFNRLIEPTSGSGWMARTWWSWGGESWPTCASRR